MNPYCSNPQYSQHNLLENLESKEIQLATFPEGKHTYNAYNKLITSFTIDYRVKQV